MKKLGLLLVLLITISCLLAQNDLILEIEIIGNQNIETDLINSMITLEVGDALSPDNISKSITNLYQLGVFEDVRFEKLNLPQGVSVQVYIKEFPIVNEIDFDGNKKIKDNKLKDVIDLREGSYWSPFLQKEVAKTISEEYKKKGYHQVVTNFEVKTNEENKVDFSVMGH